MKYTPIHEDVREAIQAAMKSDPKIGHYFTAIGGLRPDSAGAMSPGATGFIQAPKILGLLAPDVVAGKNRQLVHMDIGDDALIAHSDLVGFNDTVRSSDVTTKLVTEEVEAHGWSVPIDNDEVAIANAAGINIVALKSSQPREIVELNKEINGAAFFATTTNYASASHYATLSGTDKFSDATCDVLKAIADKIEFVRSACGTRPDTLGMGASVMNTLAWHPKILDLLKTANVLGRGIPITAQIISLLLNVKVAVGDAIYKPAEGGTVTDVWADNVYLCYVGNPNAQITEPRFAMTAVSPDYPQVIAFQSKKGLRGGQEIRYGDCYKTYSGKKTAGYAFLDVV